MPATDSGTDVARLARNSAFNVARAILTVPLMLVLIPYIIGKLGILAYGVWVMVGVIITYAQMTDLGIGTALVKFVAEYAACGAGEHIREMVNTALVLYVGLCLMAFAVMALIVKWVTVSLFSIPGELQADAQILYLGAVVVFGIGLLAGPFTSTLLGLQEMQVTNAITFASSLLTAAGTFVVLELGWGLRGLILNAVVVASVSALVTWLCARRIIPDLRVNPVAYFRLDQARNVLVYGLAIQVSNVSQLLIFQIDRILLSHFLSPTAVAYYDPPNRVLGQVRGLLAVAVSPTLPAASDLHARRGLRGVRAMHDRVFRYTSLLCIPTLFFFLAFAQPFCDLWLGAGFGGSGTTMRILAVGFMVNILTAPGHYMVQGVGRPQYSTYAALAGGATSVALSFILLPAMGYYGIVAAVSASLVISAVFFLFVLSWRGKLSSFPQIWRALRFPVVTSGVLAATAFGVFHLASETTWHGLGTAGALYWAAYSLLAWNLGGLHEDERRWIRSMGATVLRMRSRRAHGE